MTLPVIETIAAEIEDRIGSVTEANGYSLTVGRAYRPSRLGEGSNYRDLDVVIVQNKSTRDSVLDCFGNPPAVGYSCRFDIYCIRRQSDKADSAYATLVNELEACVRKALTDATNWHTFGGGAVNADCGDSVPFISPNGEFCGSTIPLKVWYRHDENDPYQAR